MLHVSETCSLSDRKSDWFSLWKHHLKDRNVIRGQTWCSDDDHVSETQGQSDNSSIWTLNWVTEAKLLQHKNHKFIDHKQARSFLWLTNQRKMKMTEYPKKEKEEKSASHLVYLSLTRFRGTVASCHILKLRSSLMSGEKKSFEVCEWTLSRFDLIKTLIRRKNRQKRDRKSQRGGTTNQQRMKNQKLWSSRRKRGKRNE